MNVVLDDRLLIEELLVGIRRPDVQLHTTAYWYYRACRAAVLGAGGHLSGPFRELRSLDQQRAIGAMLQLPERIGLPSTRQLVPLMVEIVERHPKLNLLNLEAVAAARVLAATIWLSPEAASGALPAVLDVELLAWEVVTPT
ncbi:MAG: hypothetical protein KGJ10_08415 [Acidobacteriota bacterium]|nr:hypothetical protein [Acidobacteriota bacterium]MDE3044826.1 hypothetical protein [Acidobacteriota bacterium]MDE3108215.1 hypothetical protein [Acidobacteriota bacterium]MDE3223027.1 hypothetical protein [Acidobacteriota bacterium]